jgi:hypothetical protein
VPTIVLDVQSLLQSAHPRSSFAVPRCCLVTTSQMPAPHRAWECSDGRFTVSPCNDYVAGPIGIAPTSTELRVRAPAQERI